MIPTTAEKHQKSLEHQSEMKMWIDSCFRTQLWVAKDLSRSPKEYVMIREETESNEDDSITDRGRRARKSSSLKSRARNVSRNSLKCVRVRHSGLYSEGRSSFYICAQLVLSFWLNPPSFALGFFVVYLIRQQLSIESSKESSKTPKNCCFDNFSFFTPHLILCLTPLFVLTLFYYRYTSWMLSACWTGTVIH